MLESSYDAGTGIPYLLIFVDFLKALVWPLLIAFVVYVFRDDVRPLFSKIDTFGPTGVTLRAADQKSSGLSTDDEEAISFETIEPLVDPIAIEIERSIKEEIEKIHPDHREDRLLRGLTFRVIDKQFLRAYILIFGSQIHLLELLNSRHLGRAEIERRFDHVREANPSLEDWSLGQYLEFLFNWNFIEVDGEWYAISPTGKLFLSFLAREGLPKDKPL